MVGFNHCCTLFLEEKIVCLVGVLNFLRDGVTFPVISIVAIKEEKQRCRNHDHHGDDVDDELLLASDKSYFCKKHSAVLTNYDKDLGSQIHAVHKRYRDTVRFCNGIHAKGDEDGHERVAHRDEVVLYDAAGNA